MDTTPNKNKALLRRKAKMLLLLPAALIPLVTLAFYAMGGGRGPDANQHLPIGKGLNTNLPAAKLDPKQKALNKLGFYKKSDEDSIRLKEKRRLDPYWGDTANSTSMHATELFQKLDQLKGALNRQEQGSTLPVIQPIPPVPPAFPHLPVKASRIDPDPDLDKLNTLMDKVLRVRYPGDPSSRDTPLAPKYVQPIQTLSLPVQEAPVTTFSGKDGQEIGTGFIDLDDGPARDTLAESLITAVIDGTQTVTSREEVTLRTSEDAFIAGTRVPRGTLLSGNATLSGERLLISINALRIGNNAIRVSLDVVDLDGATGIRVKGSITRDASKESAGEAVTSLGTTSFDPGVAGQATAAGIQTAKSLLSRNIRLVRVGLPEGYRVLLRNNKPNH